MIHTSKQQLKLIYKEALLYSLPRIEKKYLEIKDTVYSFQLEKHQDYPVMDNFDSGVPHFSKSSFKKNKYISLLKSKEDQYDDIAQFKKYYDIVQSENFLRDYYELDEKAKLTEKSEDLFTFMYSYLELESFIERYIHFNEEKFTFNQSTFDQLFEKRYNSIFKKVLPIDIYVPLLFLDFEIDFLQIDENISLERIPENIQLARNTQTSYLDSSNNIVAGSAKYALVLRNWTIENSKYDQRRHSLYDINSFKGATEIVSIFLSSIRISTGYSTGTSQIVSIPIGWEDSPKADIQDCFCCSIRNYPSHFDNYGWLEKPPLIELEKLEQIKTFFNKIRTNNKNNIKLAISRLNTAFLRSKEEDTILDTTIALETLITHDSKSEITYRLSSRIAALCEIEKFEDYNQLDVFNLCKKIYSFRSDVIHGNVKRLVKSRMIKPKDKEEIPTILLSISLLRHVLKILLLNSSLSELENIDKLKFKN